MCRREAGRRYRAATGRNTEQPDVDVCLCVTAQQQQTGSQQQCYLSGVPFLSSLQISSSEFVRAIPVVEFRLACLRVREHCTSGQLLALPAGALQTGQ